jgi:RimJ/RimL family protein N-acetyltransferase
MRITREAAEAYFAHPSQRRASHLNGPLPEWATYYAQGDVCGAFHAFQWPGVVVAHLGVKPRSWGRLVEPARAILSEVWADLSPDLIVAMVHERNRAVCRFAERVGMKQSGRLALPDPVLIYEWRL